MPPYAQSYTSPKEDTTRKSTNELLQMPSDTSLPQFMQPDFPNSPATKIIITP